MKQEKKPGKRRTLSEEEIKSKILNRVSRVEGQFRGIRKMIEEKKDCIDVITQISAVKSAVSMLGMEILKNDFACKRRDHKAIGEEYLKTLFKMN